jgi:hypothetical protein
VLKGFSWILSVNFEHRLGDFYVVDCTPGSQFWLGLCLTLDSGLRDCDDKAVAVLGNNFSHQEAQKTSELRMGDSAREGRGKIELGF